MQGSFSFAASYSDDCNEIRRKIRLLQKQPDFKVREYHLNPRSMLLNVVLLKVTHWLKDIGGINSNSFGRFSK
jgi:hypothetical protein